MKNATHRNILLLIVLTAYPALFGTPNLIDSVVIDNNIVKVTANPLFAKQYLREPFFAEYDHTVNLGALDYSIVTIPFIMNIIPIIWISNQNYAIDSMDEDLFNSLQTIKKVYQLFYPSVSWSGDLIPKKLIKNSFLPQKNCIAALFSHGLDAVHTSLRNRTKKQVLITIGGGDIMVNKIAMWNNVKHECLNFASNYGQTCTFVRANFNAFRNFKVLNKITPEIFNWFSQASQALGYVGLAAPIAYTHRCPELLIASTYTIDKPFADSTHPAIDNNIHVAGITVTHDSPDRDRIEKTRDIAHISKKYGEKKPFLRVCWGHDPNGRNCGKCEKCLRTIIGMIAEGESPHEYGFDLNIDQAIDNSYTYMPTKKVLKPTKLWYWDHIQKSARDSIANNNNRLFNNPRVQPFLSWVAHFDLEPYRSKNAKKYSQEDKTFFETLWQQGVERTLTSTDLDRYLQQQKTKKLPAQ